jgi:UMF1 family MFS transporter
MSDPRSAAWRRSQISWALWDFGATGVNAIVVTFVFSVYLTSSVGHDLPG